MSKDVTISAQDAGSPAKPGKSKQVAPKRADSGRRASKPKSTKPKSTKPKSAKPKSGALAEATAPAPTKAAVKKAAKAATKAVDKAATKAKAPTRPAPKVTAKTVSTKIASTRTACTEAASVKPIAPAKSVAGKRAEKAAPFMPPFPRSFQGAVPAAFAMNTKLVDIAHSNVSAGLELARDLAGAKTPIEALRLGVAYWFNHMSAVQAQARELQSLSATWVETTGERMRPR